ncbi:cell death protein Grim-like [Glossina fuscipes]|uniref:Cell death protein Grim-like n=1 Tax=Glossina fuscipes TaxID=7396 RepID=A0A8U0W866_9MUSC|nr:cell death protein Grim-like [Glossina fuscipes]
MAKPFKAPNIGISARQTQQHQPANSLPSSSRASPQQADVDHFVNAGQVYHINANLTAPSRGKPLGCWDFLIQTLCFSLRSYSKRQRPVIIKISSEFKSQRLTDSAVPTVTTSEPSKQSHGYRSYSNQASLP